MAPRILAVDDDPDLLGLLGHALSPEGYRVACANSAAAALAAIRQEPPALVILDLWLEDRAAGWRLLRRLRADPVTLDLPVVVASADIVAVRRYEAALRALGCAILEKPFDLDTLLAIVARHAPLRGEAVSGAETVPGD